MIATLAGCAGTKRGADTGMSKKELAAAKTRFESAVGNGGLSDCLQAKARYTFSGKSLSGKFNLEHGKRLCMTVTVLGIEMARIEADTKDVYVVDKLDKIYSKVSVGEFASKIGLQEEASFDALEALFLGRIFVPGQGIAKASDFKRLGWTTQDNGTLTGTYRANRYNLVYSLDVEDRLNQTVVNIPNGSSSFAWTYGSWSNTGSCMVPASQTVSAKTSAIDLSAQITLSGMTVGNKGWTSFTPQSGYREVTFPELIEKIKKMSGK